MLGEIAEAKKWAETLTVEVVWMWTGTISLKNGTCPEIPFHLKAISSHASRFHQNPQGTAGSSTENVRGRKMSTRREQKSQRKKQGYKRIHPYGTRRKQYFWNIVTMGSLGKMKSKGSGTTLVIFYPITNWDNLMVGNNKHSFTSAFCSSVNWPEQARQLWFHLVLVTSWWSAVHFTKRLMGAASFHSGFSQPTCRLELLHATRPRGSSCGAGVLFLKDFLRYGWHRNMYCT